MLEYAISCTCNVESIATWRRCFFHVAADGLYFQKLYCQLSSYAFPEEQECQAQHSCSQKPE